MARIGTERSKTMKLAEALLERKSLKEKIESLRARLAENVMVQEGDKPAEDPQTLMSELNGAVDALETLIKQINATNNSAKLPDGMSVSEAKRLRELEAENKKLKKLLAETMLEKSALSEALNRKW